MRGGSGVRRAQRRLGREFWEGWARQILALHESAEQTVTEELVPKHSPMQIQLFEPVNYQVADRIRAIKLDELRPIEALQLLAELQKELQR